MINNKISYYRIHRIESIGTALCRFGCSNFFLLQISSLLIYLVTFVFFVQTFSLFYLIFALLPSQSSL